MDNETRYRHSLERYGNGDLSRRGFLRRIGTMALGAGIALSGTAAVSRTARAAEALRFDGYGGTSQQAFTKRVLEPLTQKTGVAVNQGSFLNPEQLFAKAQADGLGAFNYFTSSDEISPLRVVRLGWGAELDESRMPRLKDVIPKAVEIHRKLAGGKLISVPYILSGVWLAYNRERIDPAEVNAKGYDILIDPKYKGAITGEDRWMRRIWYAALQSKQDPNDIKDMKAVWDKVRESKSLVVKYWTSGTEQAQLLSSGNAVVSDAWFVPIFNLKKKGMPIEGWPKQGSGVSMGSIVVLKGAPLDPLYEMIDILLRPEVCIPLGVETGNLPLLDPNKHPLPPEAQELPGYDPTGTLAGYMGVDPAYWTDNSAAWQREYTRVIARG